MTIDDRDGPSVEELFTTVRLTSPTADGHWPHVHLGFGLGLGPVSALSRRVDLEVRRDGSTYRQRFARGVATSALVRTDGEDGPTGTRGWSSSSSSMGASPEVFGPVDDLIMLFDHLFAGERFATRPASPILMTSDGDHFAVDIALGWATHGSDAKVHSYGNYRSTTQKGRHVEGIEEGLRQVFGHGPMKRLLGGLRAVVHVTLMDPVFVGPTREELDNPEAVWLVADTIAAQLPARLEQHPELAADLADRAIARRPA